LFFLPPDFPPSPSPRNAEPCIPPRVSQFPPELKSPALFNESRVAPFSAFFPVVQLSKLNSPSRTCYVVPQPIFPQTSPLDFEMYHPFRPKVLGNLGSSHILDVYLRLNHFGRVQNTKDEAPFFTSFASLSFLLLGTVRDPASTAKTIQKFGCQPRCKLAPAVFLSSLGVSEKSALSFYTYRRPSGHPNVFPPIPPRRLFPTPTIRRAT